MDTQASPFGPGRPFSGFEAQWTPIERSSHVRAGAIARVRVAGTDVVLFRAPGRPLSALLDRCPHRGVALSLGRLVEGEIECPFHGWRFDGSGACTHVPLCDVPESARARMRATPLEVRELGGLVWLWTSASGRPPAEPELHPMLAEDSVARSFVVEEWRTHWTRAMENMLDYPHLPFVHRRTIGAGIRSRRPERLDLDVVRTGWGMEIRASVDGAPLGEPLAWRRPNGMVLTLSSRPRARLVQHVFCVPVDRDRTRMIVATTRDGSRWSPLGWLGDRFNGIVLSEDRRIVESSTPAEVPDPSEERSVATDAPTLAFRRWYLRTLLEKRAAPAEEPAARREAARG